jgi:hypothetical protein
VSRGVDRTLPIVQVGGERCGRELRPGEVKRCPLKPPYLVGYAIACPSCGFIATHLDDELQFVEVEGALSGSARPAPCILCGRDIWIRSGHLETAQR